MTSVIHEKVLKGGRDGGVIFKSFHFSFSVVISVRPAEFFLFVFVLPMMKIERMFLVSH